MKIFIGIILTTLLIVTNSCNYTMLHNRYNVWEERHDVQVENHVINLLLHYSYSCFHKNRNEMAVFTTLSNKSTDIVSIDRNSFYALSSSGDTAKLQFINTTKFNNSGLLLKPQSEDVVILIFLSNRRYSYDEYKKAFKSDTIYLFSKNIKTNVKMIGTYIKKERQLKD